MYHEGVSGGIRFLGWGHHYITDWGTPPHYSTFNANPVPALAGLNAILGGLLGGIGKSGENLETTSKGIVQGVLMGTGILGGIGALGLLARHQDFEERCDQRWKENSAEIKKRFKNTMERFPTYTILVENLYSLEIMMDELKKKCDLLSSEWIHTSQNDDFIEYMVNIAIVINFATYIVIRGIKMNKKRRERNLEQIVKDLNPTEKNFIINFDLELDNGRFIPTQELKLLSTVGKNAICKKATFYKCIKNLNEKDIISKNSKSSLLIIIP